MREIVHIQAGQCGNQIGAKVRTGELRIQSARKAPPVFSLARKWCSVCSTRGKGSVTFRLKRPVSALVRLAVMDMHWIPIEKLPALVLAAVKSARNGEIPVKRRKMGAGKSVGVCALVMT